MTRYSILDLCFVGEGKPPQDAYANSVALAQQAEQQGFERFWLAEHHNMPGIASAATSLVISHVAANTRSIKVGAGGIMLPNHSPLQIAEQFGTLETLYPGRIEIGLGRAPGTDQATAYALRRNLNSDVNQFPRDVVELQRYFEAPEPNQKVRAFPGEGLRIPLWILGSSLFGADLAAHLGLPYSFASHFAPADLTAAVEHYRSNFKPSAYLSKPYVMVGYNVIAADTGSEAEFLASSMQQSFCNLRKGTPGKFPPPVDNFSRQIDPQGQAILNQMLACTAIGSYKSVRQTLEVFIARVQPDELIFTGSIYDINCRLHSFSIVADVMQSINASAAKAN